MGSNSNPRILQGSTQASEARDVSRILLLKTKTPEPGLGSQFSLKYIPTEMVENTHTIQSSEVGDDWEDVSGLRFIEFIRAVKRVARLQRQAVKAQIDARQKRRQAGFKRRDVWIRDAAFMKELQKLIAQGKFKGFEDLLSRANECQAARDELGPLEEDGIEAEQELEGDFWRLRLAQESMFDEFREEIQSAENHSSGSASETSSQYESETQPLSVEQIIGNTIPEKEIEIPDWEADSGVGDLDRPSDPPTTHPVGGHSTRAIYERYPELSTEFKTKRDRINRWLLNTVLISHLEAEILRKQLEAEDSFSPSSWAQLVIAKWEEYADSVSTPRNSKLGSHKNKGSISPSQDSHSGEQIPARDHAEEHSAHKESSSRIWDLDRISMKSLGRETGNPEKEQKTTQEVDTNQNRSLDGFLTQNAGRIPLDRRHSTPELKTDSLFLERGATAI